MKKQILGLSVVVVVLLASCATNRTVSCVTSIDANNYEVEVLPMMATLDVQTHHVTGTFKWEGKKQVNISLEVLRDNAIYNALQKCECDVLVAPQYQVVTEYRGRRKYIIVSVTGYPAKYINFTPAPQPGAFEVKELKDDSNYMIISKDSEGVVRGYQVVVPYDKNLKTLDLEETTVDKIILNGKDAKIGRKRAPKSRPTAEPQNIFDKMSQKMANKKKGI